MQITSVQNNVSWFNDALLIEKRKTYRYDKGNDVTVVERRTIQVTLYDRKGQEVIHTIDGNKIDLKV